MTIKRQGNGFNECAHKDSQTNFVYVHVVQLYSRFGDLNQLTKTQCGKKGSAKCVMVIV